MGNWWDLSWACFGTFACFSGGDTCYMVFLFDFWDVFGYEIGGGG